MNSTSPAARRFDPVLAAIVVLAATGGALLIGQARNWVVMPDELIYTEMSRSVAGSLAPLPGLQGRWAGIYQVLYPTLISPLAGALRMTDAYSWIVVLNATVMASAAIPAYLLASWATESRAAARWVALCTVVTPWLVFATKVLPDATAYAAAAWAFYAIARTAGPSERPLKGDLLALLAVLVAYLARSQFLLLVAVWVGAVVLAQLAQGFADGGWRGAGRSLLRTPLTRPVPVFVFIAVVLLVKLKPIWIVGTYLAVTNTGTDPFASEGIVKELINHASTVGLGIAALPVVLGLPWLLTALTRIKDRRQNNTAILILLATGVVLYVGASFDMRFDPTDRVIERYVFYVAPLWFVAMAAFFRRPPTNLPAFALPALAGALLLIATQPYGLDTALGRMTNRVFSPTQVVLIGWQKVADAIGTSISGLLIVLLLLVCAFAWWMLSRQKVSLAQDVCFGLVVAVLLAGTLSTVPDAVKAQNAAPIALFGKRTGLQKRWVEVTTGHKPYALAYAPRALLDRPIGGGPSVERRAAWRDLVFWNRRLAATYAPYRDFSVVRAPIPGHTYTMIPDWATGQIARSSYDDSEYLVQSDADPRFAPQSAAPPVRRAGFALYKLGQNFHAAWAIRGLTESGFVPPRGAMLRVWAPRGAKRSTTLQIRLTIETTKKNAELKGFKIDGAGDVRTARDGLETTFTWKTKVTPGGRADFELVRGDGPAHVNRVSVSETSQGSAGTSR